jgi:hypothetical protein
MPRELISEMFCFVKARKRGIYYGGNYGAKLSGDKWSAPELVREVG